MLTPGLAVVLLLVAVCDQTQAANEPVASPAPAAPKIDMEPGNTTQTYLDSLAAENKLSGAILVAKDGVPIASKASGVANKTTNAPITLETKFNLGSMNKMFTGIAVTQLAQEGKLDFNNPSTNICAIIPTKMSAPKLRSISCSLTHREWAPTRTINFARSERS